MLDPIWHLLERSPGAQALTVSPCRTRHAPTRTVQHSMLPSRVLQPPLPPHHPLQRPSLRRANLHQSSARQPARDTLSKLLSIESYAEGHSLCTTGPSLFIQKHWRMLHQATFENRLMKGKPITHFTADHAFDISCSALSTCPLKHHPAHS